MSIAIKEPKSVKLEDGVLAWLRQYREQFKTEVDCALTIGVDRLVINRVLMTGSCSARSAKRINRAHKKHSETLMGEQN